MPEEAKKKQEEFEAACAPLMKYLAEKQHPHTRVILDASEAELVEGVLIVNKKIIK